jgi:ABC-type amino acid transport substrate-binding protein
MFSKLCIFLSIIIIAPSSTLKIKLKTPPAYLLHHNFSINLARKFQQHELILHVDNTTKYTANTLLKSNPTITTIFNHDAYDQRIRRPVGLKCTNVVLFADPFNFSKYLLHNSNIHYSDVIIFVTLPATFNALAKNYSIIPNLDKAGKVVICNYNQKIEVYVICFYCGTGNGLTLVETFRPETSVIKCKHLLPQNFENFYGHTFKIAYIDYFPYVYCTRKHLTNGMVVCDEAVGSEYQLLVTLSEALNFTFILFEIPNNSYDKLFDDIRLGSYDLAIGGMSVTNSRRKIVHFSDVIKFENIAFSFVYKMSFFKRMFFLHYISSGVKLAFNITVSCLALFIFLTLKLANRNSNYSFVKIWTVSNPVGPIKHTTHLFQMLQQSNFEQPVNPKRPAPVKWTISILFVSWWLFSMIVGIIMKSRLTALMMHTPVPQATLTDLLNDKYQIMVDETVTKSYMSTFIDSENLFITR